MNSLEKNLETPGVPTFNKREKQIAALLTIDIGLTAAAVFMEGPIGRLIQYNHPNFHIFIMALIGILIFKIHDKKPITILHWALLALSLASRIAPQVLTPLRVLTPFSPAATLFLLQWLVISFMLLKKLTRGRWPLPFGILFLLAGLFFIGANLSFKTTEFGPLGMLFANMFATPPLLLMPALFRIPAGPEIKRAMAGLQYTTYACVVLSWIIFLMRSMK